MCPSVGATPLASVHVSANAPCALRACAAAARRRRSGRPAAPRRADARKRAARLLMHAASSSTTSRARGGGPAADPRDLRARAVAAWRRRYERLAAARSDDAGEEEGGAPYEPDELPDGDAGGAGASGGAGEAAEEEPAFAQRAQVRSARTPRAGVPTATRPVSGPAPRALRGAPADGAPRRRSGASAAAACVRTRRALAALVEASRALSRTAHPAATGPLSRGARKRCMPQEPDRSGLHFFAYHPGASSAGRPSQVGSTCRRALLPPSAPAGASQDVPRRASVLRWHEGRQRAGGPEVEHS